MTPRRALLATAALCAFALLTLLVAVGAAQGVDVAVRDQLRPDDVWGTVQVRVDVVVEGLKPVRTLSVFVAFLLLVSTLRRSWRPVVYGAVLLAVAGVPALAVKQAMARTDPHHDLSSLGSYPSGHVLVVLVCLGGVLLLHPRAPRSWGWCLVAVVDLAMAVSLLVQAAHWLTDVIGGAVLGVAALALTAGLAQPRPPSPTGAGTPRRPRPRSAPAQPS